MIVVTGASGMLGSHIVLAAALAQKPVCGLYRSASALNSVQMSWAAQGHAEVFDQVIWRQVDLLDALDTAEALDGATRVVHAAAIVSFRKKDEAYMLRANPQMSENLWLAALDQGVRFGLHISSIATLSVDLREPVVTEANESKRDTLSAYGKSKLDAELVAWRYHEEGLPLAVFHPSVILGPPAWPDGSSLFPKTISRGLPLVSPGATGWVDVRDVAESALKALELPPVGERFILNGANASFKSVFSLLASGLGVAPPKYVAQPALLEVAWRLERAREFLFGARPLLTQDSVRAACQSIEYSGEKARAQGYSTRPIEETTSWVAQMHHALHP
ncbi:MAG TPA: hypothetical protein DCG68_01915 [Cryomorphaceae bacterium]|nr:hypothetical protein [Cryomorphaceae bacterium]